MRRSRVTAAVAALLVPAMMWATVGSASAASGSLTVTTIGRNGVTVASTVTVFDVSSGTSYSVRTGKARSLPKGTYTVLVNLHGAKDGSDTLAARVLKVSGPTRTTIDARAGRPLRVALSPAGVGQLLQAQVCGVSSGSSATISAYNDPGKLFVLPNTSKYLRFAFLSTWRSATSNDSVAVSSVMTPFPATALSRSYRQAALTPMKIAVKRGPAGSRDTSLYVRPGGDGSDCRAGLLTSIVRDDAPYVTTARLSAGTWGIETSTEAGGGYGSIGTSVNIIKVAAGKTYTQTFFNAVWGPGGNLPYVVYGGLAFAATSMFLDPAVGTGRRYGWEASEKAVVTLSLAGKVLKRSTESSFGSNGDATFEYALKKAGVYTLAVDARRYYPGLHYPADMLSPRSTVTFRFRADPKKNEVAPVVLPRLLPGGLDLNNRAKPRSSTRIGIRLDRRQQSPDAALRPVTAKTVTVRASFDGGRTWRAARVQRAGATWTAFVTNPAAGAVALRAKVTDAKGNSSEVTIYRAYAIG